MYSTSIVLPSKFKTISETKTSGVYEIEGLAPGYGHTLGNSLRRIILSSIPGTGIISFKVNGALHEFDTLPGVHQDVLTIILNLKRARFHLIGDEPQTITLVSTKTGIVTAGEFQTNGVAEVLTPDQPIAEITDKSGRLEIDITLAKGLGLISRDNLVKEKAEVGHIIMDAVFTPIMKAHYEVENMRVGDRTDHNRLRVAIETDGTITPHEALESAIHSMITQLQAVVGFRAEVVESVNPSMETMSATEENADVTDVAKIKVEDLGLSTRTENALIASAIRTAGGLSRKTEEDLVATDGLGEKGIIEIKKALADLGLTLKA